MRVLAGACMAAAGSFVQGLRAGSTHGDRPWSNLGGCPGGAGRSGSSATDMCRSRRAVIRRARLKAAAPWRVQVKAGGHSTCLGRSGRSPTCAGRGGLSFLVCRSRRPFSQRCPPAMSKRPPFDVCRSRRAAIRRPPCQSGHSTCAGRSGRSPTDMYVQVEAGGHSACAV